MATLIRPKRWGFQRPPPGTQINWGHPLAQGLSRCWLFGETPAPAAGVVSVDRVVGDVLSSTRTTGVANAMSPIGKAWQTAASGGTDQFQGSSLKSGLGTTALSVACFWRTTPGAANPNIGPTIYATRIVSGDIGPCLSGFANGGTAGFFADGPGLAQGAQLTDTAGLGVWHQLAGTYAAGPDFKLYLNGVLGGSNNYNASGSFAGTWTSDFALKTIGSNIGTGTMFAQDRQVAYLYVWTRALTGSDIQWLYAEPYAMFQPQSPQRRYWVIGSGGLANVWNGSAWVQKPAMVWNGSAWVQKPVEVWTGAAWKASS